MKKIFTIFALVFAFAFTATAQETAVTSQTANEGFIGYSFVRENFEFVTPNFRFDENTDSNGVNASYTRYLGGDAKKAGEVGLTADLGANFRDGNTGLFTAMGGLTLKARNSKYVQPYGRVLGGVARQNVEFGNLFKATDWSGVYAVGGGVDINVKKYSRYKLRLGADYLNTGFAGERQNNVRLTTGLVF